MCLALTFVANGVQYMFRPSHSDNHIDQCSETDCVNNNITFSLFANDSINYLTNDVRLVFSPGIYTLESKFLVENVHSLSMFVWPISSSKALITCGPNARFEFRNVSIVNASGFEFDGCFENHVVSVDHFQLENSRFIGNGQVIVNGTVLIIENSTANLDSVAFISAVETLQTRDTPQEQELPLSCTAGAIETIDAVTGIMLRRSNIQITQSSFEGNRVGLGAVIYDAVGSDITIVSTTFVNNSAAEHCNNNCCFAGGIVYVRKSQGSTVKLYHTKFEKNFGVAIFIHSNGQNVYTSMVSITHSEFVDNTAMGPRKLFNGVFIGGSLVHLDSIMVTVSFSKFTNNRASVAVVYIPYQYTVAENLTNNVFSDNSATYDVFVSPSCLPGLTLSLGSTRCVHCSANWHQDLIRNCSSCFYSWYSFSYVYVGSQHDSCCWYSQWNIFLCSYYCSSKCRPKVFFTI